MIKLSKDAMGKTTLAQAFPERSDVAHEIISRKPAFFEQWALVIFLTLLTLLALATWFIKYPDIIEAKAVLTGQNAPKEILSKRGGNLIALFIKNNQQVKQGEIVGWLESNASAKEVIDLSERLESGIKLLAEGRPEDVASLFKKSFTDLGELQVGYQTFIIALQQFNDYLVNGFYSQKRRMLHGDIVSLEHMKSKISQQKEFTTQESEIARKTFEMNDRLYKEGVISKEEYRQAQSILLSKQKADPQMEVNILLQENQIREKRKEMAQVEHDIIQQQQTFDQALQTMKSNVDEWLRNYTLQAPVEGAITFALPLQRGQYIQEGKLLGYVNPPDSKYYVELRLSQTNFGKVTTGMKVQLQFDAYPYQEVGAVQGTLNYISNVAVDSTFWGIVHLDNGLHTNQNKNIQYRSGLKARALIITKDMRLLQRIYYSIVRSTAANKEKI